MPHRFFTLKRLLSILVLLFFSPSQVWALPQVQEVVSGSADIRVDQNTMTILATDNTILNYSSFDLAPHESFIVNLPSNDSRILNRVTGHAATDLLGHLISNGLFILINPNGIYIGPQARIEANNLIMSTRQLSNQDFLDEKYLFEKSNPDAFDRLLLNAGTITLKEGGFGVLIAGGIENTGSIIAPLGKIALASGDAVRLDLSEGGLIAVAIDEKTASAIYDREGHSVADQIKNTGVIEADGGMIILSAASLPDLFATTINLDGIVRADLAVSGEAGQIALVSSGDIISRGTLKAQALTEEGAAFDIGGTYQVVYSSIRNADGAVNLSTGNYSGTISDVANIIMNAGAILTLTGDTVFLADSASSGTGLINMNSGSSIAGNNFNLTLSASQNSTLRAISGVGSLTLNRSSASRNPIFTANNPITASGTTTIASGVSLNTGSTTLTTNHLALSGALTAGSNGTIDVNGNFELLAGAVFTQGTSSLNVANDLTLAAGTTFRKATSTSRNVTLDGTGKINDQNTTKQDLGNVVIGGTGVTRQLQSASRMTRLTIGAGNIFSLEGNNFEFSANRAVVNDGTFRLKGSETLTRVTSLDNNSGLVEYTGDGDGVADTFTLKDFGTTDFYNLRVNFTDSHDVLQSTAAKVIAGQLQLDSGTFNLNGQSLTVNGSLQNNGTVRLRGSESVTLRSGNDIDSGTWHYAGDGDGAADTFTLKDFGAVDYFNLKINPTDSSDVIRLGAAVTINGALNVDSGIFDLNGYPANVVGVFTNNGTLRLRGSEAVNLASGNDIDSGTWQYIGDGDGAVDTFALKDFGSTDYFNLIINTTDTNDVLQLNGGQTIAGALNITKGTLDFNGQDIRAVGSFANNGTVRLQGKESVSLASGNDIDSGTWQYVGDGDGVADTFRLQDFGSTDYFNLRITLTDTADVVELDSATVMAGTLAINAGTLDLKGNSLRAAGTLTNDGKVRLQGNETITLAGNDTNSGTWEYVGNADGVADVFTLREFGGTDFFNLTIALADPQDVVQSAAAKTVAGALNINSGTLSLNGNSLTARGAFSNEATLRLRGNETVSLTAGNDLNSGTWQYVGDGDGLADTFSLKDFGATDYFNLAINMTDTNDLVQLGATTTIAGSLRVDRGTLHLNTRALTVTGSVSNDATIRLRGDEVVTLVSGNDTNSGTWDYIGTGTYGRLAAGNEYYNLSLNGSGRWTLAANLDLNGTMTIGTTSTLTDNGKVVNVAGDWSNRGTYIATGSVILDGVDQHVLGATAFNDLTKIATTSSSRLIFEEGKTQVIKGALNLQGVSATDRLMLRSSVDGAEWNLFPTLSLTVANLDVKDSNAIVVDDIACLVGCFDSTGNTKWFFPAPPPAPDPVDPVVDNPVLGESLALVQEADFVVVEQVIGTLPIEIPNLTFDPREFPTNRGKGGRSAERFEKVWATDSQNAGSQSPDFEGASFTGELASLPQIAIPADAIYMDDIIAVDVALDTPIQQPAVE